MSKLLLHTLYGVITESNEGIELGTAENVYIKSNALQKMGPKKIEYPDIELPQKITESGIRFHFVDEQGMVYANEPYIAELPDGRKIHGLTDENGRTKAFYTDSLESVNIQLVRLI